MSLQESGDSEALISLAALFDGKFQPCKVDGDSQRLMDLACRGGWPEMIRDDVPTAQLLARNYLGLFYEQGERRGKSADLTERLVTSVARNLGQACTRKTYIRDMMGENGGLDQDTLASYLDMLHQQYVINEVPGWVPPARSPKRLRVKPKRYLADPSLAVAALGMGPASLLHDWQTFGLVFENMAMRDLEVYTRALPDAGRVPLRYYRDDEGLEVDAIIELADGQWAGIEVKVSEDKVGEGVDNLRRLRGKLLRDSKARVRPPAFMAVVVGIGQYAREVEPGIYVVPLRALGA
jgi:predicted AAA+ superfamily ATPase